jgi:hypothetical protein
MNNNVTIFVQTLHDVTIRLNKSMGSSPLIRGVDMYGFMGEWITIQHYSTNRLYDSILYRLAALIGIYNLDGERGNPCARGIRGLDVVESTESQSLDSVTRLFSISGGRTNGTLVNADAR